MLTESLPSRHSQEAHKLALKTMDGLVMAASRVLLDDDFYAQVKADFKKMKETV